MSEINVDLLLNNPNYKSPELTRVQSSDIADIGIFYHTQAEEKNRSSFSETFASLSAEESEQGQEFLKGLIENKKEICEKLNITPEQYDMYSCLALALASQETGMGSEVGYMEENTGFGKIVRGVKKFGHVLIGGGSASSGLTQMKINDFVNKKLSDDEVKLLKSLGVKAFFLNTNNLFDNPDKAAAATIVVLNLFAANYDEYKNMLKNNHEEIGKAFTDSLTEAERIALGEQKIAEIMEVYVSVPNDVKSELRNAFKDWLKSANDTTLATYKPGDELNEEKNLQEFNEILMKYGFKEPIKQEDLNYIRYYLTSDSQELSLMEYCAYAWNKGIGETGMQLDRTLIDKIGIIFANPEDFDYDQFTVNVVTLAEMYAQQIGIDNFD